MRSPANSAGIIPVARENHPFDGRLTPPSVPIIKSRLETKRPPFSQEKTLMSKTRIQTIDRKFRNFAARFRYPVIALALMNICPLRAPAQDGHSHTMTSQHEELTPE